LKFRRANSTSGDSASISFFFSCAMAASCAACAAWRFARAFLLVELDEHLSRLHDLVDVHVQTLDDAVRLRLDLDLGDRLHLPGGNNGPQHHPALDGRQLRGIDGVGRAVQRRQAVHASDADDDHSGANCQSSRLRH
jgi:hypothetical protein